MKIRLTLPLCLAFGTLLLPAPVLPAPRLEPRPPVSLRRVLQELNLSPAQRRQLAQVRRVRQQEQVKVGPQLRARRRALAELYRAYPLDEAKAKALIGEIAELEGRRLRLQLQNQIDLRRILTREQFTRFTQLTEPGPRPAASAPLRSPGP
jgi:Spy/CpxP family protein refolding chaperone